MEPAKMQLVEDFDATWRDDGRWQFSNGPEFPGAKGSFERSQEAAHGGEYGGKLSFDFSGGGNYVAAILKLSGAPDIQAVRLWLKNPAGNRLTFRYTDPTGQTLQRSVEPPPPPASGPRSRSNAPAGAATGAARTMACRTARPRRSLSWSRTRARSRARCSSTTSASSRASRRPVWTYPALRFEPAEGWHASSDGKGAKSKLAGKKWQFDFTKGGEWAGVAPHDLSLLGTPKQFRIRFRGNASGHTARLRLATHFMTFERNIGEAKACGGRGGRAGVRHARAARRRLEVVRRRERRQAARPAAHHRPVPRMQRQARRGRTGAARHPG